VTDTRSHTVSTPRRAGASAAAILAALLALILVLSFRHTGIVVPTNGVTAGGPRDNPGGAGAVPELQARANLQQWPGEPQVELSSRPSLALGAGDKTGPEVVQQWLGTREANQSILREPAFSRGTTTLPAPKTGVLEQPQGRTWRSIHNNAIFYGGAIYIFGLSLLIALFLAWRGRIPLKEGFSSETVERFSALERANHWLTAGSFLAMALTGLVILYGDFLIRPWLGADAFSGLAAFSSWSHIALAVPFVLGVLVMIALWTRQNLPERLDWQWLRRGGGFLRDTDENPPARRFNTGQKIVFWGVVLGGIVLTLSGLALAFPFYWLEYTGMQVAQIVHAAIALLLIGLIIGHIYIGTVGMQGAFSAMWSGRVDRNWAREHHDLWYRQVEKAGPDGTAEVPARAAPVPRSAVGSFSTGVVLAVVLAAVLAAVYQAASVSSNERWAGPSVHLDEQQLRGTAARR
jgi:formate dehydrogenase subunit gamma